MYTLTHTDANPHSDGTGYNDFPENWKEITESEFAQSHYFTYSPDVVEYRQMLDRNNPQTPALSATLYWMFDNTGYGIAQDYWGKRVRYFKFGCKHQLIPTGDPDGSAVCPLCGFHYVRPDSSD